MMKLKIQTECVLSEGIINRPLGCIGSKDVCVWGEEECEFFEFTWQILEVFF